MRARSLRSDDAAAGVEGGKGVFSRQPLVRCVERPRVVQLTRIGVVRITVQVQTPTHPFPVGDSESVSIHSTLPEDRLTPFILTFLR